MTAHPGEPPWSCNCAGSLFFHSNDPVSRRAHTRICLPWSIMQGGPFSDEHITPDARMGLRQQSAMEQNIQSGAPVSESKRMESFNRFRHGSDLESTMLRRRASPAHRTYAYFSATCFSAPTIVYIPYICQSQSSRRPMGGKHST